jgi:CO dehydrogenase nickel-insertion accessory protein CooC1
VANKVTSPADEQYIRAALPGRDIVGVIPWSEEIRSAERQGRPVLDQPGKELLGCFESILRKLDATTKALPREGKRPRGGL